MDVEMHHMFRSFKDKFATDNRMLEICITPFIYVAFILFLFAMIPPVLLFSALPSISKFWQEGDRLSTIVLSAIASFFLACGIDSFIEFIYSFGMIAGRIMLVGTVFALVLDLVYFYPVFTKKSARQDNPA